VQGPYGVRNEGKKRKGEEGLGNCCWQPVRALGYPGLGTASLQYRVKGADVIKKLILILI
jgi:hypothetical protein